MMTKDVQGRLWSAAPADWVQYIEPSFIPMYQDILSKVPLNEEQMLLDAGCGSGLFLTMAAPSGIQLHGIDAAPALLDIAKHRLPGSTLLMEDLESLPFIDGSFDVVTGFNSFEYAGSFEAALAEARRVVKWHGKLVIGIWGKETDCESAMIINAVAALLPPQAPATQPSFALGADGKMEAICNELGLKVLSKHSCFCPWLFNSADDLLRGFLATAYCANAVSVVGEEAVKNTILQSSLPFNITDEVYYLRNHFTCFITEKINLNRNWMG